MNTTTNQICEMLKENDPSALEMIWDTYSTDLQGYLTAVMCSRTDAEDTLQEIFLTIARNHQALLRARQLKPYLFRLARNTAINRIKKEQRRRNRIEEAAPWLAPAPETDQNDAHAELSSALAALPEKQRVIVVLKHYRQKTFADISEMLGISPNTAASRYRYGIEKLKTLLSEQDHEKN